jgi:hypothetical protein
MQDCGDKPTQAVSTEEETLVLFSLKLTPILFLQSFFYDL